MKVIVDVIPRNSIHFLIDKGETETKVLTLVNLEETQKLKIVRVLNPLQGFDVKYEPFSPERWNELMEIGEDQNLKSETLRPEKGDYLVTVTVTPEAIGGRLNHTIKLLTNMEKKPEIDIEVLGRIQGPMIIIPNFLNLDRVPEKLEESVVKEFTLQNERKEKFKILDISADHPFFSFDYTEQQANSYRLKISYNGGLEPGRHYGYITIKTDCNDHPVIDLRYNGWVVTPEEMARYQNKGRTAIQQRRTPGSSR